MWHDGGATGREPPVRSSGAADPVDGLTRRVATRAATPRPGRAHVFATVVGTVVAGARVVAGGVVVDVVGTVGGALPGAGISTVIDFVAAGVDEPAAPVTVTVSVTAVLIFG